MINPVELPRVTSVPTIPPPESRPQVPITPQRIETTRGGPDGGLSLTTTGPQALPTIASASPSASSMTVIADYLMRRRQAQQPIPQSPMYPRAAYPPQEPGPSYIPTLGSAASANGLEEKYPERYVPDPFFKEGSNIHWGPAGTRPIVTPGPGRVKERFIGGKWEFDNVDPRRQGAGGAPRVENSALAERAMKYAQSDLNMDRMTPKIQMPTIASGKS